jgi:hypothetical protein
MMADSSDRTWTKLLKIIGTTALAIVAAPKVLAYLNREGQLTRRFDQLAEELDRRVGWDRLPTWASVLTLLGLRHILRRTNLYGTDSSSGATTPVPPPPDAQYLASRTADGTYNDLDHPKMGSAGTRFGRNVPLTSTYPEPDAALLSPNPRTVSLELLTRHTFQPVTTLNVLAAAWVQFMVRDWLSHGRRDTENPWEIPLPPGDTWYENPMRILRTRPDPARSPADAGLPPTYINTETHWWDTSQIYGSSAELQQGVRSGVDGKLHLTPDNLLDISDQALDQQPSLTGWWVGLELMFTLFAREHNAICDHLKAEYPSWDDEALFQHARLINAALLAKIHTVEWTTAILGHPALQIGMRANWWGIATEQVHKLLGRISSSEVISGIPGSQTEHFGVPYSITEEFVAVYRMHPLIPDDYQIRSARTGQPVRDYAFPDLAGTPGHKVVEQVGMADLLYSFGIANPGAIRLHNYPRALQRFERPDGIVVDLAAHDILRVRELGVPRYNEFRRLLHLRPAQRFEELTDNPAWAEEIRRVYDGDIERVDLMVGMFGERFPAGFGFSDTAFRIFILMASRRLNSDRFFTTDFTPAVYTPLGMRWIDDNTMGTVLLRHFPALAPALRGSNNAFAPWSRVGDS